MPKYDVLSPDGFSIHPTDTYKSKSGAFKKFYEWKKRYEKQGYYSSAGGRIDLEELEKYCKLVTMLPGESLINGKQEVLYDAMQRNNIVRSTTEELARKFVGDGKRPNKFFVTIGYGSYQPHDKEEIIQVSQALHPVTILVESEEQARHLFDAIQLKYDATEITSRTISEVLIEDRITGTVKQKYFVEKIRANGTKCYIVDII